MESNIVASFQTTITEMICPKCGADTIEDFAWNELGDNLICPCSCEFNPETRELIRMWCDAAPGELDERTGMPA